MIDEGMKTFKQWSKPIKILNYYMHNRNINNFMKGERRNLQMQSGENNV